MSSHTGLETALIFLAAAVITVPLFKRFGLATVLGYLFAGSAIGPWGLNLVPDGKNVMGLAELGVVLLLFIIGLELKPSRLWLMRRPVFGMGSAQVLATGLILTALGIAFGLDWRSAGIVGFALSLSSTAFALQLLSERNETFTPHGRASFAILLLQDLAAIPLLALVPLLNDSGRSSDSSILLPAIKVVALIVGLIVAGKLALGPIFRRIARVQSRDLFTAATLLLVLGVAFIMEHAGVSMALGAFLAGVLLADSEFRHELEADIEPFKGLLLGLFFVSVGMYVDYGIILKSPLLVIGLVLGLMVVKGLMLTLVARGFGQKSEDAFRVAALLPQGGEFAFVVFAAAVSNQVLASELASLATVIVTLSMALTPLFVIVADRVLAKKASAKKPEYDKIESDRSEVIIAGLGRVGQMSARVMRVLGVKFTALDHNSESVEVLRRFGHQVYYGDASRLDLLEAAGARDAKILILALDDVDASLRVAATVRSHFPQLKIIARARNRQHAFALMDLGIETPHRETFATSLEMAQAMLEELGYEHERAAKTIADFRMHDERMLQEQYAFHDDEERRIAHTKIAMKQLSDLINTDQST